MKYIKLFEYFERDAHNIRRQVHKDEEVLFQDIVNMIKVALGKDTNDIEEIKKSITEFGHSWYIVFENGRSIRISDHSLVSTHRIMDSKYIDFINLYDDFSMDDAKKVVGLYRADKILQNKKRKPTDTVVNNTNANRAHSDVVTSINAFQDMLAKENKTIYRSVNTRDSLYMFKKRRPTAEMICQVATGDTYTYIWVDDIGMGREYPVSKDYYDYLKKNNII